MSAPPFSEHPSGEFRRVVDALTYALERLFALPGADARWIVFCAQGQGSRLDSYRFAKMRLRGRLLDVGTPDIAAGSPDLPGLLRLCGVDGGRRAVTFTPEGFISLGSASPREVALLLDAIFRYYRHIRPYDDGPDDYGFGAEWQPDTPRPAA